MLRLRHAVMAIALGTSVMGCTDPQSRMGHYSIWHCDECDDFPTPKYGPGNSMMPGTYTGQPPKERSEPNRPANGAVAPGTIAPPPQSAVATPPAASMPPAVTTPSVTPPATPPGLGAANSLSNEATGLSSAVATSAEATLPQVPTVSQDAVPSPVAYP
jgi:hypothetical protein